MVDAAARVRSITFRGEYRMKLSIGAMVLVAVLVAPVVGAAQEADVYLGQAERGVLGGDREIKRWERRSQ